MVLIFFLVLRAVNVSSIKKYFFLKRKLFVTLSNPETTAKTADVAVERHTANWNQSLDPLQVLPLSLQFYGISKGSVLGSIQSCTTVFTAHISSLCEAVAHPDTLLGTHEMRIPLASQSGSFC